jgi:hypothetical protein
MASPLNPVYKTPPKRSQSLSAASSPSAIFTAVSDDLHDARRVYAHGQEEDLKLALSKVITRVEELVQYLTFLSIHVRS